MRHKGSITLLLAVLCLAGNSQIPVSEQFHLEVEELKLHLANAPLLTEAFTAEQTNVQILLPTPKGVRHTFHVWEDPILSEGLQDRYPDYRTYFLEGEDHQYTGRLMLSPAGLDGVIICGDQVLFIESIERGDSLHRVYYWKLGPSYLSFEIPEAANLEKVSGAPFRLAILVDEAFADFHRKDLARALISSVNGVNAIIYVSMSAHLDLHYFDIIDQEQVAASKEAGFQGRTGEAIKLFGDAIAEGKLQLEDFDIGHFLSGRGFGGSALAGVAGSDTYYDWNEDGIFDGPAKAGGGSGTVRPTGANWWGSLCQGIHRQIRSSSLVVNVQRSASYRKVTSGNQKTAGLGNLEHFPVTMNHYSGPGAMGEGIFPHLSCLPFDRTQKPALATGSYLIGQSGTFPGIQAGFAGGALWPLLVYRPDQIIFRNWLQGWRF